MVISPARVRSGEVGQRKYFVLQIGDKNFYIDCPFNQESRYIYYGEIPNMRGHCVISNTETGELFSGYHCSDFIIDEDL